MKNLKPLSVPSKVSPSLWNKLTPHQQRMWKILYKEFRSELMALRGVHKHPLTAKERFVLAHNMAFRAVWVDPEGWKKARDLSS